MSMTNVGAALVWLLILVYGVLGAIDFGSSFWRWHFNRKGNWSAELVARNYVSSTWELINAFLVLIPVTLLGLFPGAVFAYGTILPVPATLLLTLLALRGAYWQFGYASSRRRNQTILVVGLTGVILPGVFSSLLPLSQGGFVEVVRGNFRPELVHFFLSPVVYLYMVFGSVLALFVSSVFLSRYAYFSNEFRAFATYRRQALWTGPVSLAAGVGAIVARTPGSLDIMGRMMGLWPLLAASMIAFAVAYTALFMAGRMQQTTKHMALPNMALVFTLAQLITAHFAYGFAHRGYWLYPYIDFQNNASNRVMFHQTLVVLLVGMVLLAPGFLWFRRLFITNVDYAARKSTGDHRY